MLEIITTYEQIDPQQWQALIDRSPYATWFQTPEAYAFYTSAREELSPFVIGVCEDTQLTGVVVGYTTKEKNPIKQRFTSRSIVIGGPLLAEDISDEALTALLEAIRRLGDKADHEAKIAHEQREERQAIHFGELRPHAANEINKISRAQREGAFSSSLPIHDTPIYIEIRNFHDYSRWREVFEACGFEYQPHLNIQVACDAAHSMSEQRQRQVKKATKNGVEVVQAQSEQEVRDWYRILRALYRTKVRTPLFAEEFFLQFYRQQRGIYLLVKHHGKVIGGMMCPILEGKAIYEWYVCGLDEEYKDLYPSVMATHAAIEYAKTHHLPLLDFMGAGVPDVPYGVRDFKMEFGGELVEIGRFLYVRKPLLYKIGKLGVKWLKRGIHLVE